MKLFFSNIWKYLCLIAAGIIAGLVFAMKQMKPDQTTNVTASTYIADQEQNIGKLKQRGEGNTQDLTQEPAVPVISERKQRRLDRRSARRARREAREAAADESESNDTGQ